MEVECIGSPGTETNSEEEPVSGRELSHQGDWVLERIGVLPLGVGFTIVIGDDDTLLPDEEILPGLLSSWEDALGEGIGGFVLTDFV